MVQYLGRWGTLHEQETRILPPKDSVSGLQTPLRNMKTSDSQPRRTYVYTEVCINFKRSIQSRFPRLGNGSLLPG